MFLNMLQVGEDGPRCAMKNEDASIIHPVGPTKCRWSEMVQVHEVAHVALSWIKLVEDPLSW